MAPVFHVRFHGRGGEGVKLASRIVSRTAFLAGYVVQDSPLYGAERRGAPVVAFVRFSRDPILERGYIAQPGVSVVMDESLLIHDDGAVLDGLDASSLVLVNSRYSPEELQQRHGIAAQVVAQDISTLVLDIIGHHLLSAPIAGFTVKAIGLAPWDVLVVALRHELAEAGLTDELIERNLTATRTAYDAATAVGFPPSSIATTAAAPKPFVLPRLPARTAAPSIMAEANTALRSIAGWRVHRPVIDLTGCTRCFLCFALCPEGAIHLDAEHYPIVDYEHCKGCLVCVAECPPKVIAPVREEAA